MAVLKVPEPEICIVLVVDLDMAVTVSVKHFSQEHIVLPCVHLQ